MVSQHRRGRASSIRSVSQQRFIAIFAVAFIMLSSIGGILLEMRETGAQQGPDATEVPQSPNDPTAVPISPNDPTAVPVSPNDPTPIPVVPIEQDPGETDGGDWPLTPDAPTPTPQPGPIVTLPRPTMIPGLRLPTLTPNQPPSIPFPVATQPAPRPPEPIAGVVNVIKYYCPEGVSRTEERLRLNELCRRHFAPVEFSVSTDSGYFASASTVPGDSRALEFTGVPFGEVAIRETVPVGSGEPLAFCSDDYVELRGGRFNPVTVENGDTVRWGLRGDTRLPATCIFYNIQDRRDVVRVLKFTCPPGVFRNEFFLALYDQCHENPGPTEFTVTGSGGYVSSAFSDGSIPEAAVFAGVPFGEIRITETVPAGYGEPLAFCGERFPHAVPVVDGDSVVLELRADAERAMQCQVFNFWDDGESVDPDSGTVRLSKYTCPDAFQSKDQYEMMDHCREVTDPVEFSVTSRSGYRESEISRPNTLGSHEAEFTGIPHGQIEIAERVPRGFNEPFVLCADSALADDGTREFTVVDVVNGAIEWDLQTNTIPVLRCLFFNSREVASVPDDSPTTGRIIVHKLTCPEGIERSGVDYIPSDVCSVNPGPVEFSVTGGNGYVASGFTFGHEPHSIVFTDVPFGAIEISETVPAGYGEPLAFCAVSDGAGAVNFVPVPVVDGDTIAWELRADIGIEQECYFVNFEAVASESGDRLAWAQEDAGDSDPTATESAETDGSDLGSTSSALWAANRLEHEVHGCPAGVMAASSTLSQLIESCVDNVGPIPFTFYNGTHGIQHHTTDGSSPENQVAWTGSEFEDDYFAGNAGEGYPVVLAAALPGGYDSVAVYCTYWNPHADVVVWGPSLMTIYGSGGIEFAVDAGHTFSCDWFFFAPPLVIEESAVFEIPGIAPTAVDPTVPVIDPLIEDDPEPGADSEPTEVPDDSVPILVPADPPPADPDDDPATGRVTVFKLTCPEGVSGAGVDYFLSDVCRENPGPVEFTVTGNAGYSRSALTPEGDRQTVAFADVPFGDIEISETLPAGYGEPLVFCADTLGDAASAFVSVPVVDGNTVAWEHRSDAETELRCGFVNFMEEVEDLDPGTGTVRLSKYTCPEGVARSAESYLLSEQCREEVDPAEFTVSDGGAYSTSLTATGGVPQEVEFTDVPFGEIEISETVPAGYGEPLVFCSDTPADGPGNYEPVPVVDGDTIAWDLRADSEIPLTCIFFNFEGGGGGGNVVMIQKWTCSPVTAYGQLSSHYYENCLVAEDENFEFTLTHRSGSEPRTTAGGWITWEGVPMGPIGIQEAIPAIYGEPVVLCYDGATADFHESPTGYFEHEFTAPAGQQFICDVFNLTGESSILTVVKFTCPEGYGAHAAGADPTIDCPEPTNGVEFTLDLPDATSFVTTTGDSAGGQIQFGGLPPGSYTLTESVPPGVASSFVLDCFGNLMGGVRPYPLATGDTLHLEINAGESITCLWYNVPEHNNTSLTVHKYTCSTLIYVSDVDCEVYEDGQTFDLVVWNGAEWEHHSTATTDGLGQIHWPALNPLEYWLDEHDREGCHIASEQLSGLGEWFIVAEGQETVVKVYNCDGVPGEAGETPTRYPNTGAPHGRDDNRVQP